MTARTAARTHFRLAWRTLAAAPLHTLIAVGGLALGLAAFALLTGFVRDAWSVNAGIPAVDRLYVVKGRDNTAPDTPWREVAPMALAARAQSVPGVETATVFVPLRPAVQGAVARVAERLVPIQGLAVLPGFAKLLGLRARDGDVDAALARPDGIVLADATARRLFGTPDAVGRTLRVEGQPLRVAAVLLPETGRTTIPFDALAGVQSAIVEEPVREELLTGRQGWPGRILVRLEAGADPDQVTAALQRIVDASPAAQQVPPDVKARLAGRRPLDLALSPLRHAYFDDRVAPDFLWGAPERGNAVLTGALGAVALLILVLAGANYVNLATVRVLRRQRELAVRKALGASARDIALQCLAEALCVALVAGLVALGIAWLALPPFAALAGRDAASLLPPAQMAIVLGTGCALGLATALYPAWLAMRVQPDRALAGRPDTETRGAARTRRTLTVLQLAAAMGVGGVALAVSWQAQYAARAEAGFDPGPLTLVDLPDQLRYSDRARGLATALAALPGIDGVTVSLDAVGRHDDRIDRAFQRPGGTSVGMNVRWVGANFFTLYGIRPAGGRLFDPRRDRDDDPAPLVINAVAARTLGFPTAAQALGQTVLYHDHDGRVTARRVIGIAPPLRFQSLREREQAVAFELSTAGGTLTVRSALPPAQVDTLIRSVWPRHYPDALPRIHRAGDVLARNYADDARLARLLALATGTALALAAFGCYALSAHTVQRRAREIVLRKLHGAGRGAIGVLVLRETGLLAVLAAVVGLPVAFVVTERYLAGFVEREPDAQWALACALGVTLAVAAAAAARHAWSAMRAAPVDVLRT